MVKRGFWIGVIALLGGCDRLDWTGFILPPSDRVEQRFEQSMSLHGGEPAARLQAAADYPIYLCTDPHIDKEIDNLVQFADQLRGDLTAPFGVVLGDCIDRRGAMPRYAEALEPKPTQTGEQPIFSLLGNHDLFFEGWEDFRAWIGPSVYWFEVEFPSGRDLFLALDTASGTLGRGQYRWLCDLLTTLRPHYRHCVILTHTNLFYTDTSQVGSGNMPMEETLALLECFAKHRVSLVVQGHDHVREEVRFGEVDYLVIGTIRQECDHPEYLRLNLSDRGIERQWEVLK